MGPKADKLFHGGPTHLFASIVVDPDRSASEPDRRRAGWMSDDEGVVAASRASFVGVLALVCACTGADAGAVGEDPEASGSASGSEGGGSSEADGSAGEGAVGSTGSAPAGGSSGDGEETSGAGPVNDDTGTACVASLSPGLHTDLELEHDGQVRVFDLFVPAAIEGGERLPLVIDMHGWGSNKERQATFSQMAVEAEARGYAVVHPQGYASSWNGGYCCGGAVDDEIDDVGFLRAIIDRLEDDACIARDRVYAAGFSNGAYMAYRLACEAADAFAAIAPVAGVIGLDPDECDPERPISVIHFHGTADLNVAYDGRPWLGVLGARETMEIWADRNGCESEPVVTWQEDDVTCETWPGCDADVEVTLCTIEGAGHCWPGTADCNYGTSTTTISANARMFDTFDAQPH